MAPSSSSRAAAAVLAIAVCTAGGGARAALIFSVAFDEPTGTVLPDVDILIEATLTLDASSDALSITDIQGSDGQVTMATTWSAGGFYNFDAGGVGNGSSDFFAQFLNLSLQPGESFGFTWGAFVATGSAPIGTTVTITQQSALSIRPTPTTDPTWVVVQPDSTFSRTIVPEPSTASLLTLGLLGLAAADRSRRAQ